MSNELAAVSASQAHVAVSLKRAASALAWICVIGLLASLGLVIGRTYVGHSPSPYGVCYGALGRPIPCELASAVAAARSTNPGTPPAIHP